MMTPMVPAIGRILIVPMPVVNRNLNLRSVAMVQTVAALVVVGPIEILGVVDIRIVVKASIIAIARCSAPSPTISLLRLLCMRNRSSRNTGNQGQGDNQ